MADAVLALDGFAGPLERLLDRAERGAFDLSRVSVLALAEQLAAILAGPAPVEARAAWLVLAARLLLLRSRLLLPRAEAAAEAAAAAADGTDPAAGPWRAGAAWLVARPRLGHDVFARAQAGPDPRVASLMALLEACLVVLRGRAGGAVAAYRPPPPPYVTVAQAVARLRAMLSGLALPRPLPAVLPPLPGGADKARAALGATFLAALELAREGSLTLLQEQAFGPIVLTATQRPVMHGAAGKG